MPQRTTLITEDFNRANANDIGATWDVQTGQTRFGISSNTAIPASTGSDCAESYNGISWPDNQWVQAALTTTGGASAGRGIGLGLRMSAAAATFYRIVLHEGVSANINVSKIVAGVFTAITNYTTTYAAGGVLLAEIIDTTIIVSYQGVVLGSVVDSSIASGRGGIVFSSSTTTSSLDTWLGGGYVPSPGSLALLGVGQ